ncbi:hypothetical protein DB88DRAFT_472253 [Papiliotrema laurentii]|uniref:Uncharacterized protein n=1 Tax=Papiliotrema laurentii TaxID=5418 RepID=A0AAD9FRX2_PAPLA|nr:hypothetical protein DB88DRAFT_472253 [Papiliotrema laurentii]
MVTFVFAKNSVEFAIFVYATHLWAAIAPSVSATVSKLLIVLGLGPLAWRPHLRAAGKAHSKAVAAWGAIEFENPRGSNGNSFQVYLISASGGKNAVIMEIERASTHSESSV